MFFRLLKMLLFFSLIFLLGCGEESKVSNTCNQFMKGRIALKKGDASILEQITEDSLFKLLMLHHDYAKLINAPIISPDLNIHTKSVEMKENCASCLMSGLEYYQIHLCKHGEVWKVEGENDIYPTTERIKKAQKKFVDREIFIKQKPAVDSVILRLNTFFGGAKVYFKTHDLSPLKELCDEPTLQFVQNLYKYTKQKGDVEKVIEEMAKPNILTSDVNFDSDKITCKFYQEETTVLFKKKENSYIVSGICGIDSKDITQQLIEKKYPNFLRALKLIRSEKYRGKNPFW